MRGFQRVLHIDELLKLNVDQMFGIEIDGWPARIAEVAMWLVDHQINQKVSEAFGDGNEPLSHPETERIAFRLG